MAKEKKKGMNLPNKITCARLVLSVAVLIILCVPWDSLGVTWKSWTIKAIPDDVSLKYIVAGILFAIGSFTDFLDGFIARKYNMVTDFGKVMDAIADKVLVNGVLIVLAFEQPLIPVVIPVIIICRDIAVDSLKMVAGSKKGAVAASWPGKVKTICMMVGLTLVFFYNMPFAFIGHGLRIDYLFVYVATIMSIVSGLLYFNSYKDVVFSEM